MFISTATIIISSYKKKRAKDSTVIYPSSSFLTYVNLISFLQFKKSTGFIEIKSS